MIHRLLVACTVSLVPLTALADGTARPDLVIEQVIKDMPMGDQQQVRVLTATLKPGGQTPFHTHQFPVTIYVMSGTFTLEMEGREPVHVQAGEALIEPANVKMTGYNRSETDPMHVVIFYVSNPATPFLDPIN